MGTPGGAPSPITTNGWDAVCALNTAQVNQLFLQQYFLDGPNGPGRRIRYLYSINVEGNWNWNNGILDIELAPMQISVGSQGLQFTAQIAGGRVIGLDSNQNLTQAYQLPDGLGVVQGTFDLNNVAGVEENEVGRVVATLSSGSCQCYIPGIPELNNNFLNQVLTDYFNAVQLRYVLGSVVQTSAGTIQPSSFELAMQPDAGGAILLLIQTTGKPGTPGPLPSNPIPAGSSMALLVSNAVTIAQGVLPTIQSAVANSGSGMTCQASTSSTSSGTVLTLTGGQIDLGIVWVGNWYTSYGDAEGDPADMIAALSGFTVQEVNGELSGSWTASWRQQPFSMDVGGVNVNASIDNMTMQMSFSAAPSVNGSAVQFTFQPQVTVTGEVNDNFTGTLDQCQTALESALASAFGSTWTPEVGLFLLTNLLFGETPVVTLTSVAFPGDLQVSGYLQPSVPVTPSMVALGPGQSTQFAAPIPVIWNMAGPGNIDQTGLYTAPASLGPPTDPGTVVSISATAQANENSVGYAFATVANVPDPCIMPPAITVGSCILQYFSVTDDSGNPIADATASISPSNAAKLTEPGGVFELSDIQQTLTVTTTGGASMTVQVAGQDVVTVQAPNGASTGSSGSVSLVAKSQNDTGVEFGWLVDPPYGTVSLPNANDTTNAVYSLPSPTPGAPAQPASVTVYAYHLGSAFGMGSIVISI